MRLSMLYIVIAGRGSSLLDRELRTNFVYHRHETVWLHSTNIWNIIADVTICVPKLTCAAYLPNARLHTAKNSIQHHTPCDITIIHQTRFQKHAKV